MNTLRRGSMGSDVIAWLQVLAAAPQPTVWTNARGEQRSWTTEMPWPLPTSLQFDKNIEAATEAWQFARKLMVDGVVGPITWAAAGVVPENRVTDETIPFVQAKHYYKDGNDPRFVVIHDMEYPERPGGAKWCADFFAGGSVAASAHYAVDNNGIVQCVRDEDGAWHTPGSLPTKGGKEINRSSIGIEHAGYAKQTAKEWLDDYSMAMLTRSAELVARLCVKHGIPPVRLTSEELRLGAMGICGHVDCTKATGVGSHWDPGPGFPWDWYMARVKANHNLIIGSGPVVVDVATDDVSKPLDWPIVKSEGVEWFVAPEYIWPISIGGAADLAKTLRCELPSPKLVDDIWKAADLKIDATKMARSDHNGTAAQMASLHMFNSQAELLERQIAGRSFKLLDGNCKNIVELDGVIGIYGAHRADGTVIQGFYPKHVLGWIDYFQGLRLTRRVR